MKNRRIHNTAGYTLIELLTVVTIIGILASIAIPNYRGYRDKAKVVTVVSTLRQIRLAQEVYWTDHQKYFQIDPTTQTIHIDGLDMDIMIPNGQTYSITTLTSQSYTVTIETNMDRNQNGINDKYIFQKIADNNGNKISETPLLPLSPIQGT